MATLRTVLAAFTCLALLAGCGTRTENDDSLCEPEKPKAYSEPPVWADCDEIRTNESVIDPNTGELHEDVHRLRYCCP